MGSIKTIDQAHAELADALWWLRGFEAATTSDHDDTVHDLWVGLREVRLFLDALCSGAIRRLGEEQAIVISFAEFEQLYDSSRAALRHEESEDGKAVVNLLAGLLVQYQKEAVEARDGPDIPF